MESEAGAEPRPVEVVGVRGYGVPLPFTTSAGPPANSPAPLPVAAPRRRRWLRVLLAAGVPVVLVAALYLIFGADAKPASTARPAAPTAEASKSPADVKAALINAGLVAQSQALLGGDLNGFLAPVDAALHGEFTQRFNSLRALSVAQWTAQVVKMPLDDDDRWPVQVKISYCLGAVDCASAELLLTSTWTVRGGRAVATTFQRTVLPWDLTPLQAVAGRRVIVAAPASLAGQLARTLTAADEAADVADQFARWGPPPKRYVVYLAGPEQWRTWWNGQTENFDGYAQGTYGVAIQIGDVQSGLKNLLTHEFAHVVSLVDADYPTRDWWLAEGLAEYAADRDGSWTRDRLPYVRRYLRSGRWDGTVTLGDVPEGASKDDQLGRYGLALLTVTCLAKRFGEDRMLAFFAAVVRDRSNPETVAPTVLGTEWAPVATGCAAEVRARAK